MTSCSNLGAIITHIVDDNDKTQNIFHEKKTNKQTNKQTKNKTQNTPDYKYPFMVKCTVVCFYRIRDSQKYCGWKGPQEAI